MIIEDEITHQQVARWLRRFILELHLCPFAALPLEQNRVHIVVSDAADPERLLTDLLDETFRLSVTPRAELSTTLLVAPRCFPEFADFNDFHGMAGTVLGELGLADTVQLVAFHPQYCFADSAPEDAANYTNRAPLPLLQLLREDEVSEAVQQHTDPTQIYQKNIQHLRELGSIELAARLNDCRATL